MAQRESITDLINRLGVEKPDPRLRTDPYTYPSEGPDVVAQFGAGLQSMGQRLESSLQAENELERFAELIPRWLAANPAQNIGALLQIREPEVEQLRGMAEGAIEDPGGTAKALGQAGIEAVKDPLGTAEQMSALEMLGGGKALSSIAKRLGRKNVGVTPEPKIETERGRLSQQLYEESLARGEVPGELSKTTTYAKRIDQLRRIDEIQDLRMEMDRIDKEIPWNRRTPEESDHVDKLKEEVMQRADAIDISDVDDYSSILDERPLLESLSNMPPQELARVDRAVKQGFNIDAFHGTVAEISEFDPGLLGKTTDAPSARKAFFFSRDAETAQTYANYADPVELGRMTSKELYDQSEDLIKRRDEVGRKIALGKASSGEELQRWKNEEISLDMQLKHKGQNIMPVKLRMTNPLVHDFKGESYRDVSYHDLIQAAKDKGHDGVIMKNTTDGGPKTDIYTVFEPQQIRSRYAMFEPEKAPREVGDKPYTGKALEDKTLELQRDIEFGAKEAEGLITKVRLGVKEGGPNSLLRLVLDEQGNVSSAGAPPPVRALRANITNALEFKANAEKELADLISGKLRTPRKTHGAKDILADAAFPLGCITAYIAYDVNQRGDK